MSTVITKSLVLIIIIILGYSLKKIHVFGDTDYKVLTRMVMNIVLPLTMVSGYTKFTWKNELLLIPFMALGINILLEVVAWLLSRNGNDMDRKYYMINTTSFGAGTFAMPFVQSVIGTDGVVACCMFDSLGTIMPSGVSYICACASLKDEKREKIGPMFVIKRLIKSPPFVANICMLILTIIGIRLPDIFVQLASKVADANGFICMFMLGLMFEIQFSKTNLIRASKLIIFRYIICIAAAVLVFKFMPFDYILRKSLVLVLLSPMGAMTLVFTDIIGGDTELASFVQSICSIISLVLMISVIVLI